MGTKRTMTLNLSEQEMLVLEELAEKKDISKTGVIKLAIRLLQILDSRSRMGHKLFLEDEATKEKSELLLP